MESIFPASWPDLTLADVEAFLADASNEGLTWEAKGTALPGKPELREAVCGFANAVGGYLLLGVEKQTWATTGLEFPDEPTLWLNNIIRDGLRPIPRYDIKEWQTGDGKHIAIVEIEPIPNPPCMTKGGEVYERVSGATRRVTDPVVLARLLERGQAATARAEAAALTRSRNTLGPNPPQGPFLHAALTVAPVGMAPDIAARLFTASYAATIAEQIASLPRQPIFNDIATAPLQPGANVNQDAVNVHTGHPTSGQAWLAHAAWDGSVTIVFAAHRPDQDEQYARVGTDRLFQRVIAPAASTASALATAMGGYGRAHVALRIAALNYKIIAPDEIQSDWWLPSPDANVVIQRWAETGNLDGPLLESIKRELLRATGAMSWEPEL